MKHCILIIVALLSFVSCQDIDVTHVAGRYYLVVTDVKEDRTLSYSPAEGSYAGACLQWFMQFGIMMISL